MTPEPTPPPRPVVDGDVSPDLSPDGIEAHVVHEIVDRVAHDEPIVRVAQMPVVVDPRRFDDGSI